MLLLLTLQEYIFFHQCQSIIFQLCNQFQDFLFLLFSVNMWKFIFYFLDQMLPCLHHKIHFQSFPEFMNLYKEWCRPPFQRHLLFLIFMVLLQLFLKQLLFSPFWVLKQLVLHLSRASRRCQWHERDWIQRLVEYLVQNNY